MAKQTTKGKKSRSAARFGARYGRKSRKLVADLEEKSKASYDCPQCGRN
ncbi:MAG: 50S ribosomal protein L37ae, partial [Methanothrix sp.]